VTRPQVKVRALRRPVRRRSEPSDLSQHAAAIGFGIAAFLLVIVLSGTQA
jgi:hypothetical protein